MNLERTIALTPDSAATPAVRPASLSRTGDHVAVGHLRAFVTALVVAHHAVLAYHPYAPAPSASLTASPWWQAFPVVDGQRWDGFALFAGFNDVFFMALMFFLSGLFVWNSLRRKGSGTFLKDRALRLGLPFAAGAAVLAPLAYYPAYLQTGAEPGLGGFWAQWRSLGNWPAGPVWFLWVLLAFGAVAAGLSRLMPGWGDGLGRLAARAGSRPALFFGILAGVSAAAYVPMAMAFTPFAWTTFGPFAFQTSRILFYAVYFLAGIAVGAHGLRQGLLAPDGLLARRWPLWATAALGAFGLALVLGIMAMTTHAGSRIVGMAGGLAFALSCAASSFALLALFVRFAGRSSRVADSFRDDAYGIYIVHYAFVSWLQLWLLKASLSAPVKGAVVILGALALSWAASRALRRLPWVARVI